MTTYDSFAQTFSRSRLDHPWPELSSILDQMSRDQRGLSILDIGCGNGRFLEFYEKGGYDFLDSYLGIDSSSGMITEAIRLHPGYEFLTHSMLDLDSTPIPDGGWRALVFLASFHHIDSYESRISILRQASTLLATGGRIFMTNWNLLDQEKYRASHTGNGDFSIKIGASSRYYHGFSLSELSELFSEAGYGVIEHRVFDGGRNILSILEL